MASTTLILTSLLVWHFAVDVDWRSHRWIKTAIIFLSCVIAVSAMIVLVLESDF